MDSLQTYNNNVICLNTHEKLLLLSCGHEYSINQYKLKKLKLSFTLKNNSNNKIMFFTHLLLLEKLIGQKLEFVTSTEHNQNFNIRKGTKLGCSVTVRSNRLFNFLFLLLTYSIRKLNLFYTLSFSKSTLNRLHKKIYTHLAFSLKKILFFYTISSHVDWDNFSYLYDETSYGLDLQIKTNYINPYINRLLLSHYGLIIV